MTWIASSIQSDYSIDTAQLQLYPYPANSCNRIGHRHNATSAAPVMLLVGSLCHSFHVAPDPPRPEGPSNSCRTVDCREPCPGAHCSLHNMSSSVHLLSMLAANGSAMLHHFVQHYVGIGIRPSNMAFVLDVDLWGGSAGDGPVPAAERALQARASLAVLAAAGVLNVTLSAGAYARHGDDYKRDLVNRHLASLPDDAWLVYADGDEHFHFPCFPSGRARPTCGEWVDRLPSSWGAGSEFPPVDAGEVAGAGAGRASVPLRAQFPRCGAIRSQLQGGYARKWILLPARWAGEPVRFRDSHNLVGSRGRGGLRCEARGAIDHYSMSREQMAAAQHKWAALERACRVTATCCDRRASPPPQVGRAQQACPRAQLERARALRPRVPLPEALPPLRRLHELAARGARRATPAHAGRRQGDWPRGGVLPLASSRWLPPAVSSAARGSASFSRAEASIVRRVEGDRELRFHSSGVGYDTIRYE